MLRWPSDTNALATREWLSFVEETQTHWYSKRRSIATQEKKLTLKCTYCNSYGTKLVTERAVCTGRFNQSAIKCLSYNVFFLLFKGQ